MPYEIKFKSSAWRSFRKLEGDIRGRVTEAIWALSEKPRPPGAVKMAGLENHYRVRVGDYRVIYEVQDRAVVVLIVKVAHRREVYRGL